MRKYIYAALAAALVTVSFTPVAEARNRGFAWHNNGWHHNGGRHTGWRNHGWRSHGWHNHGWRHGHYHGWRGGYWGPGYWGPGVGIVIGGPGYYDDYYARDYCYVKKVRRYDANGHRYIRRVRVCD